MIIEYRKESLIFFSNKCSHDKSDSNYRYAEKKVQQRNFKGNRYDVPDQKFVDHKRSEGPIAWAYNARGNDGNIVKAVMS